VAKATAAYFNRFKQSTGTAERDNPVRRQEDGKKWMIHHLPLTGTFDLSEDYLLRLPAAEAVNAKRYAI
jgi:hypothetical protein